MIDSVLLALHGLTLAHVIYLWDLSLSVVVSLVVCVTSDECSYFPCLILHGTLCL